MVRDFTRGHVQAEGKAVSKDAGLRAYMLKVYNYMGSALALTGMVAFLVSRSEAMIQFLFGSPVAYLVMFAPLIVVFTFSARIHKMSMAAAEITFWVFAVLMGLSLSTIFLLYTSASIVHVFFITAGMFGGLSVLVTTLTKKMAENLSEYMKDIGLKVTYLHSDIHTLERIEIIESLRKGTIEILVGVNLLREGLDIPECGLVAILDADKEGFLRSETSLIQTIGRAARNVDGRVILYADKVTGGLKRALDETDRRREIQKAHNKKHGITPTSIKKSLTKMIAGSDTLAKKQQPKTTKLTGKALEKQVSKLRQEMLSAASNLEFEQAIALRDQIHALEETKMGLKW